MNTTPLLKDLYQHITPQYAADWIVIGTLLGLPIGTLDIIEHDHMHKATRCCNAMFKKWLEVDTTASWGKLFAAIESPAMCCDVPGDLACGMFSVAYSVKYKSLMVKTLMNLSNYQYCLLFETHYQFIRTLLIKVF